MTGGSSEDSVREVVVRVLEEPDGRRFHLVFDVPDALEEVCTVPVSWFYLDRGTGFRTEVSVLLDHSESDGRLLAVESHGGREGMPRLLHDAEGRLDRTASAHLAEEPGGRSFYLALDAVEIDEPTGAVVSRCHYGATDPPTTVVEVALEFSEVDGRLIGIGITGVRENLPRPMR